MLELINSLGGILVPILAALAIGAGTYFGGKARGRKEERTERDTQINKQAAEARQEAQEVRNETAAMSDDAVTAELTDNWVRKPAGKGRR